MKIVKTASGKQTIKMSKSEWQSIGKKAGWMKTAGMWQDPMMQEVEPWVMKSGNPYVIDNWQKHPELAYRAFKGDKNAWNELVAKCGGKQIGLNGEPQGKSELPQGAQLGVTSPYQQPSSSYSRGQANMQQAPTDKRVQ